MLRPTTSAFRVLFLFVLGLVTACDYYMERPGSGGNAGLAGAGNDGASVTPPSGAFNLGGTVVGLKGSGLVLQNNAGDDLPVGADGSFTFAGKLAAGAAYAVTVKTQPSAPRQTCSVSGATGTVVNGDVAQVTVNCSTDALTIGGTVVGLGGTGLVLQNNAGDDLIVNANGSFAFPTPALSGAPYAVTIKSLPASPAQTCNVVNGTGSVPATNVVDVVVACTTEKFTVGGTVAGLQGSGLTLQLNGGESIPVVASGPFTFPTPVASGSDYAVIVTVDPVNLPQTCNVSGGTGKVGAGNVTSITVNCTKNKYTVGGTVAGIEAKAVLQLNGGDDVEVTADGTFAFPTPLETTTPYVVSVKTHPSGPTQTCGLAGQTGTVDSTNVTTVAVTCVTNTYKIKAAVSGLAGTGLSLENNAGDEILVGSDGTVEFPLLVESGKTYAVTVKGQPSALTQQCTASSPNGVVVASDVTVSVVCVTKSFTVGGNVSGLTGSGLVLENNLGDPLPIQAPGRLFTFPIEVLSGGAFSVRVRTQPLNPSQTCDVSAGEGTVTNGNVETVLVNCSTNSFAVGGTVTGLQGSGLKLLNNMNEEVTVAASTFAFGTPISSGAGYSVTIAAQPSFPTQTCVVTDGDGTVGAEAVTSVQVACTTNTYEIGGTVAGLVGTVVLTNNGVDDLPVSQDGAFKFTTKIASSAAYLVKVKTNPNGQGCTVKFGTGTVVANDVGDVVVTCGPRPNEYTGAEITAVAGEASFSSLTYGTAPHVEGGMEFFMYGDDHSQYSGCGGDGAGFYSNGGGNNPTRIVRTDGLGFGSLEFVAGDGWGRCYNYGYVELYVNGNLTGTYDIEGNANTTVYGFRGNFDEARVAFFSDKATRDQHDMSAYSAGTIDKVKFGSP